MTDKRDWKELFPEPIISAVVRPPSRDLERFWAALADLPKEFPNSGFVIHPQSDSNSALIEAWGDITIRFCVLSLERKLGAPLEVSRPRIHYKETVRDEGSAKSTASGDRGTVSCAIAVEPMPSGKGVKIDQAREVSDSARAAVEKGIRIGLEEGPAMGFRVTDVQVTVQAFSLDGEPSTASIELAAGQATRGAVGRAKPIIIEPVMAFRLKIPEEYLPDTVGDLNSRRAQIEDLRTEELPINNSESTSILPPMRSIAVVKAKVPLAELIDYVRTSPIKTSKTASLEYPPSFWAEVRPEYVRSISDPHGTDEPPSASAGRPVLPTRPKPGIPGAGKRSPPSD